MGCGVGDPPNAKTIFKKKIKKNSKFFCLLLFEGTFTSFFKDKKSKKVTKQWESRFFLLFLLDNRKIRILLAPDTPSLLKGSVMSSWCYAELKKGDRLPSLRLRILP